MTTCHPRLGSCRTPGPGPRRAGPLLVLCAMLAGLFAVNVGATTAREWSRLDVGAATPAGSYVRNGGAFTISGSGADIWDSADAFQFVYQPLSGDGSITARVVSETKANSWVKAGVMFRETLAGGSSNTMLEVTPGNGAVMQSRATMAGSSASTHGPIVSAPHWVRVVRAGDLFTGYISPDNATWVRVGSYTVRMAPQLYVGLALTSHASGALATAVFDNVTIAQGVLVSVVPASVVVAPGGAQQFAASVVNSANAAVNWQVNGVAGGNGVVGTISISGLYRAPITVPASGVVTVAAVAAADSSRSASAALKIAPVAVSISPLLVSVAVAGKQTFVVTVANSAHGTVTWQVNGIAGGTASLGTVSHAGVYSAPTVRPVPATVKVTAVAVDDATKSATAGVTLVAASGRPAIGGVPSRTATVGQAYAFTPTTTSASGAKLTFSVANKPAWSPFSTTSGSLAGIPAASDVGIFANISISVSDGTTRVSLPAFTITVRPAATGSATVSWTAPTRRADGTPLTDLAGYRIYYGTSPGSYTTKLNVANPGLTTYLVANLPAATYYFACTAYDAAGTESAYSTPASKVIH